jgi:hypothetical protein
LPRPRRRTGPNRRTGIGPPPRGPTPTPARSPRRCPLGRIKPARSPPASKQSPVASPTAPRPRTSTTCSKGLGGGGEPSEPFDASRFMPFFM